MNPWTMYEVGILRERAHMGAAAVSRAILRETGRERTPNACRKQAQRLGVSLAVYCKCPVCGHMSRIKGQFTPDGICKACNSRLLAEKTRADVELLRSCESGRRSASFQRSYEEYERARNRYRQQKHRLREEIGDEALKLYGEAVARLERDEQEEDRER